MTPPSTLGSGGTASSRTGATASGTGTGCTGGPAASRDEAQGTPRIANDPTLGRGQSVPSASGSSASNCP
jgi:hypothetical protein